MADYIENVKKALWHSKECEKAIRKAFVWIGADPDADEPQESGLAPPEQDFAGPDHIEPTLFDDEVDDNPQGKRAAYLRLVRAFASYR